METHGASTRPHRGYEAGRTFRRCSGTSGADSSQLAFQHSPLPAWYSWLRAHALKVEQWPPLLQIMINISPAPPGAGLLPNRVSLRGGDTLSTKAAGQDICEHSAGNPQAMIAPSLLHWALCTTRSQQQMPHLVTVFPSPTPPPTTPRRVGKGRQWEPSLACKPLGSFRVTNSFVDTASATPLSLGKKYFINAARANDHFRLDLEPTCF